MKTDKTIYFNGKNRKIRISSKGYCQITIDRKPVLLHRFLYEKYYRCSILPGIDVHHIDGNKLNNNIFNLELISHKKHLILHKIGNKNRYKNGSVYFDKRKNKWAAKKTYNKKNIWIGYFNSEEEGLTALKKNEDRI